MQLTDNQQALNKEEFITEYPKISQVLLDRTLDNLSQEDSIFIFPNDLKNSPDLDKDQKILETVNQKIKTGNVIGFLGCGQERLTIIYCRKFYISISLGWMLVYRSRKDSISF